MAKELGFEDKISGLAAYYQALEEIDPSRLGHNEVANPNFFYYAGGHHVSVPLAKAREGVLHDMGCHARVEYGARGFEVKDLRTDNEKELAERADVLSVMTAPLTPEVRQERTGELADLLGSIARGGTVLKTEYDSFHGTSRVPQEYTIDPNRALFAVFSNGHVSDRNLTIQYDTPHTAPVANPGERIFAFDVTKIFNILNPIRVAVYADAGA